MDEIISTGDQLELDELENIVGGVQAGAQYTKIACGFCENICMVNLKKSSFICPRCKKENIIAG